MISGIDSCTDLGLELPELIFVLDHFVCIEITICYTYIVLDGQICFNQSAPLSLPATSGSIIIY